MFSSNRLTCKRELANGRTWGRAGLILSLAYLSLAFQYSAEEIKNITHKVAVLENYYEIISRN